MHICTDPLPDSMHLVCLNFYQDPPIDITMQNTHNTHNKCCLNILSAPPLPK